MASEMLVRCTPQAYGKAGLGRDDLGVPAQSIPSFQQPTAQPLMDAVDGVAGEPDLQLVDDRLDVASHGRVKGWVV